VQMTLRPKSSPYITMSIVAGLSLVAITYWLMFRDIKWIFPLVFIATCGLPACFWLYQLRVVLEDDVLSYRTLRRRTVVAFCDIREMRHEIGRENVGDTVPVAFSRLVVQLKTAEEIRINLQAFSTQEVHALLQRLKGKCQDRSIPYADLFL
jgi:hypothetical protein